MEGCASEMGLVGVAGTRGCGRDCAGDNVKGTCGCGRDCGGCEMDLWVWQGL